MVVASRQRWSSFNLKIVLGELYELTPKSYSQARVMRPADKTNPSRVSSLGSTQYIIHP